MKEKIKVADALFQIERIPPLLPDEGRRVSAHAA
jgi:hypothetical protein